MARQKLGQHFLTDRGVVERIMRTLAPSDGDTVLEIGPGRGALTHDLVELVGGGVLEAVEIDAALVKRLRESIGRGERREHFRLHHADVMQFDFGALRAPRRLRIVGNLPYQLSGPLLMRLLAEARHAADMHFMLQLEVAERVCAEVGDAAYSALSVLVAVRAERVLLFDVDAEAFAPPPEVRSAFVRLVPKRAPDVADADWPAFERWVREVFTMRRKKLRRALSGRLDAAQIESLGLDPDCRPQNLSADDYVRIAQIAQIAGGAQAAGV